METVERSDDAELVASGRRYVLIAHRDPDGDQRGDERDLPMTAPSPVYVYRVAVEGEMRDYASVLPPELARRAGLPARAIVGVLLAPEDGGELPLPERFSANPAFAELLHRVVGRHGPDEPSLRDEARRVGSGYVYVIDGRTPDPAAPMRAEDVIGAFPVRDGEVVRAPYLPNPGHQLLTGDGFFRLSDTLHAKLLEELAPRGDGG